MPKTIYSMLILLVWQLLSFVLSGEGLHLKGHGYEPTLKLVPGKESFQRNLISYYMYNITNPDEFEEGQLAKVETVGPYVYKETRRKYNVERVSDSVMRYTVDRYWEFMPELSKGHEETDEFNIINIPLIILANKLSAKRLPKVFNDILVDELTEKGETLIRRNEEMSNIVYHGMNVTIYTEILADILQGNIPPEFADGLFALLKNVNGTNEGTFTVQTKGKNIGDILSFNNKTKLDYWGGDFCNKIDGTDGYFFRPGLNEKSTLKIFYPQLCRSVILKWKGQKKYEGISVGKFSFPEDMLEDSRVKSENTCFCSKPIVPSNNTMEGCLKRGFVDYASCKQDSPLLISFPHFLHADEEYSKQLIGMKPKLEDQTEFLVEPKTGTILSGMRKFQFNVKLKALDNVELFRNTTFMIFPVFITERRMIVPESTLENLKKDLKKLSEETVKDDKVKGMDSAHSHGNLSHHHDHDEHDLNVLSDEPSRAENVQAEPEPEPENVAETEDKKLAKKPSFKSQSVTRNKASNFCIYDKFSLLVISMILRISTSLIL